MLDALFPTSDNPSLSPPPKWIQPAILAVCLLSVLLPTGVFRLSSGGAIFGLFFYVLFWTREQTVGAYGIGSGCVGLVSRWLDLVVIHNPERDFWRVRDADRKDDNHVKSDRGAPVGLWAKLTWFFELWIASRGIGWNIQIKNLPPSVPKNYPKTLFLRNSFLRCIKMYLGYDITQNILLQLTNSYPFFGQPLPTQIFFAWTKAFRAYYTIELSYHICALLFVLLSFSTPKSWPPLSGSFRRDAYTVRKMWGKCWHQVMRRPCSEAGRIVKEMCGFQTGGFWSRYSQIWVGFAFSAASHHAGAIVGCFEDGGRWQVCYFMVQPMGIIAEDLVIWAGKAMGIKENAWTRRIGFLWVVLWFSWTLRMMVAYQPKSWIEAYTVPSLIWFAWNFISKR